MATSSPQNNFKTITSKASKALISPMIFSFFMNMLLLTVPIYLLQLFDRVLASRNYDTLLYLTIIAIFALLIFGILYVIRSQILARIGSWLDSALVPEALLQAPDEVLRGDPYAVQAMDDINQIRQFSASHNIVALFDLPWVPIYIFVVYLLSPLLALIMLVGALVLLAFAYASEYSTRSVILTANNTHNQNRFRTYAALRNSSTLQSMGMTPNLINLWRADNETALKHHAIANQRSNAILGFSKFLRLALQITALGVGAYLVILNRFTPGMMIAVSILFVRGLSPVEQSITAWNQFVRARQAYQRLKAYFEKPTSRRTTQLSHAGEGMLQIDGVSYAPPGLKKPTLFHISCRVAPGELLVIIGPSAAGKTTLASLMGGILAPLTGSASLDSASVYTWSREDIGRHLGYLPQDSELFIGTIKENIARMQVPNDNDVIAASQWAGTHEMILQTAHAYDTPLDEACHQLSMGQRRRLSLARALYQKPQLLILDEPDANLDASGILALEKALIRAKKENMTCVVVSHHPRIIQLANKILYLQKGHVVDYGEKNAVLAKLKKSPNQSKDTDAKQTRE